MQKVQLKHIIREDNGRFETTNAITEFSLVWNEVQIIKEYILCQDENTISDEGDLKEAILAVNRFDYWDNNYNNLDHNKEIPQRILNDIFAPAINYYLD